MLTTLVSNLNFYRNNVKQHVEDLEYVAVRGRERETDRHTDRQTDSELEREKKQETGYLYSIYITNPGLTSETTARMTESCFKIRLQRIRLAPTKQTTASHTNDSKLDQL